MADNDRTQIGGRLPPVSQQDGQGQGAGGAGDGAQQAARGPGDTWPPGQVAQGSGGQGQAYGQRTYGQQGYGGQPGAGTGGADRTVIGGAGAGMGVGQQPGYGGPPQHGAAYGQGGQAPAGAGYGHGQTPGGADFGSVGGPQAPGHGIGAGGGGGGVGGAGGWGQPAPATDSTWLGGGAPGGGYGSGRTAPPVHNQPFGQQPQWPPQGHYPQGQYPGQQPGAYGGQPPAGPYPGQYPQGHQAEGWPGSPGGYPRAQGGGPGGYAQPGIGQAGGHDRGFFPDIPRDSRPQAPMSGPKIPLAAALQVKGLGRGSASNPLIAAAASLLILLGRLRTGLVEMQAAPLMDHVTREIDAFERNALMAGVNPHEALVAKYALSGTADDIVQNLPGADRGNWLQYSMVARFFHKRDSGVGFFQEVEKAMQAPGQNYNLLELMLTCLNLGFEGQYRTMPNGAADLARIRASIYETLRRVHPRPDEDISPVWNPVELGKRRRWRAIPLPMLLGAGVFLVFAAFAGLSMWINRDGAAMASELRALGQGAPALSLSRTTYVPPPPPPTSTQLERIREALADEVGQGVIAVLPKGDYIAIRVGMLQLFDSGSVEIKPGFIPLAMRITEVLNSEGGPVLVQGHTDNVPLRGTGRFKSNDQLSLARAESVREVLSGAIDDPARISVEGRGEAEPVATNDTEDGRAHNRRVEILLAREGSWQRPDEVMIEGVRPAGAPDAATDTATEPTAQMNDTTEASQ